MKKATISIDALASVSRISEMKEVAWEEVKKSFESFCLMAGVDSLMKMFEQDAEESVGPVTGVGPESAAIAGKYPGKGRLSRWHDRCRPPPGPGPQGQGDPASQLGGGAERRVSEAVGDEPDADERGDAQVRPGGGVCRMRRFPPQMARGFRNRRFPGGLSP